MVTKFKLVNSKLGLALISIREDEQAAGVFGIHAFKYKFVALIISASFPALAGAVHAWYLSYIDPPTVFGLAVALTPIAMTLFGGMGTMFGPVVGVCALWVIEQVIWTQTQYLHFATYGVILILAGIFMPGGIVRSRRLQAFWARRFGRFPA
jgi:branched-chain amino acid transport system permease protein